MNITGKEKIKAALSRDGSLEIPAVILYDHVYFRDHWNEVLSTPWWYLHEPDIIQQEALFTEMIHSINQDWYYAPLFYSRADRKNMSISKRDDGVFLVNRLMNKEQKLREPLANGGEENVYGRDLTIEEPVESYDEIDRRIQAITGYHPGVKIEEGVNDLSMCLKTGTGKDKASYFHTTSPLRWTYELWGYEGMMVMIATKPEIVRFACERYLEASMYYTRQAAYLGADIVWIEDAFTDAVSPESFRELDVPYAACLVDEIRSLGMKSVYYYTGNPVKKMEHILSIGADAVVFEEGRKNFSNDINELVEIINGRCTLFGNLHSIDILQDGTEEDMRREIKRQIRAGRKNKNRFVMNLGGPVTPATTVEKVRIFCDLAHELGVEVN